MPFMLLCNITTANIFAEKLDIKKILVLQVQRNVSTKSYGHFESLNHLPFWMFLDFLNTIQNTKRQRWRTPHKRKSRDGNGRNACHAARGTTTNYKNFLLTISTAPSLQQS